MTVVGTEHCGHLEARTVQYLKSTRVAADTVNVGLILTSGAAVRNETE